MEVACLVAMMAVVVCLAALAESPKPGISMVAVAVAMVFGGSDPDDSLCV